MYTTRFFNYLEFEMRCSVHTLKAYQNDLGQLGTFLQKNYPETDMLLADHFMIRSWIVSMLEEQTEPSTMHRKISSLRSFYRYFIREGLLLKNPMSKVLLPAVSKRLPAVIEEQKMNFLLDEEIFSSGFRGLRDHLVIEVLYATGMRLAELIGVTDADIDLVQHQVKVMGKRRKQRIIPFQPLLSETIAGYITERNNHFDVRSPGNSLLVTDKNEPLYPRLVYRIVHEALGRVTTQDKRSPHILRHSYATSLLDRGADLNAIKELLGHANLAATQIYTHNSISRLKKVYDQAHPKA